MKRHKSSTPVSALDVAAYILTKQPNNRAIPAWKMHKLVYFCQGYSLARDENPLFVEKILASASGVMIKELYVQHRNSMYVGSSSVGNLNHLSLTQMDTIDAVLEKYGEKTEEELELICLDDSAWKKARMKASHPKMSVEISEESIIENFSKQAK